MAEPFLQVTSGDFSLLDKAANREAATKRLPLTKVWPRVMKNNCEDYLEDLNEDATIPE